MKYERRGRIKDRKVFLPALGFEPTTLGDATHQRMKIEPPSFDTRYLTAGQICFCLSTNFFVCFSTYIVIKIRNKVFNDSPLTRKIFFVENVSRLVKNGSIFL